LDIQGPRVYVATAEPIDDEMRERIARHREERGDAFLTVEEPLDISRAILSAPSNVNVGIVDCLTVWLGNLLHHRGVTKDLYPEIRSFLDLLSSPPFHLIIVSNEVGMDIVPDNYIARRFRDLCGQMNQYVAQQSARVILMICGIPLILKGGTR
jgi:adenosylcobinamide kinase/adenosylcobinamide-phosphate guanylyltransferase